MDTIEFFVFAAIAVFVGLMAFLHLIESVNVKWFKKRIPQFTLIMLSLVVGALLLESSHHRRNQSERQHQLCQDMGQLIAKYDTKYQNHELGGEYLRGMTDVHESGLDLIRTAEQRIRIFWVVGGPRPPESYFEKFAMALADTKRAGTSVGLDVVYALDLDNIPPDFISTILADREVYERNNVSHLVTAYVVDMKQPNGFSVMAVDRKHALISFPPAVQVESLEKAMKFENQDQLVSDLVDWFDNQLLVHSSLRIDEWLKQNRVSLEQPPSRE